ncbi:MAG: alginate export family protein [Betaproteobacteria bacterium]
MKPLVRAALLAAALTCLPRSGAAGEGAAHELAQFQLPPRAPAGEAAPPGPAAAPAAPAAEPPLPALDGVTSRHRLPEGMTSLFPQRLRYQYSIGSESEAAYRRDADLDQRLRDNAMVVKPQVNAIVIYRPTNWLDLTLEMVLEREIATQEERAVTLPGGGTQFPPSRRGALVVDQAYATFRPSAAPLAFNLGRRNYEDERHWLYDTSIDVASVVFRAGKLRGEAFVGREVATDLDLLGREVPDRINTYVLYGDYRGIEDHRLAAYSLVRDDRAGREGRTWLTGVRAQGAPTERVNYWGELAFMKGRDEASRKLSGHAVDLGVTYRYPRVRFLPNVTFGYAFGSGDPNPADATSQEFRQSGLHTNETRLVGFSKFKIYGEALDPELSNLRIVTLGFGFRPALNVTVDLVHHRYRLDEFAEGLRNSPLTAEMNQVEGQRSKDVGSAMDIVIGVRNLFGLKRLGIDLRAGWFYPGAAFRRNEGDDENPRIRDAQKSIAVVGKLWW